MKYFDSHCHIEGLDVSTLKKCEEKGIEIISMSNDIRSYNVTSELVNSGYRVYKQFLGYHPENVIRNRVEYIEKIFDYITYHKVDGIGEIGLDFNQSNKENQVLQIEIFTKFLELSEKKGLPVSIHSRKAQDKVLEILENYKLKPSLHWFSGSKKQFEFAIEKNYFIGFTTSILNSVKYRNIIKNIPLNLILTESDAPINSKSPIDIPLIVKEIASLKEISETFVKKEIGKNTESFLKQK